MFVARVRPSVELKRTLWTADSDCMDAEILSRYTDHQRRFEAIAVRQNQAEVIPFSGPLREQQEPTLREIEVLQLISHGLTNREIANRLFLSEDTVKSHVSHLLSKLQACSRTHAVAIAFRRGLIK